MGALAAAGCASACGLRVANLATLGSGRGWLGAVVGRHTAGRNGRWASNGAFSTGVRIDCGLSYTTVRMTVAVLIIFMAKYQAVVNN